MLTQKQEDLHGSFRVANMASLIPRCLSCSRRTFPLRRGTVATTNCYGLNSSWFFHGCNGDRLLGLV